jgi:hypothetical protein
MSTLKLKDFDKVLVSYFYKPDKLVAKVKRYKFDNEPKAVLEVVKGKRKGIVVAIDENVLGWSMCNSSLNYNSQNNKYEVDTFDKAKGLSIALNRAKYAASLNEEDRLEYYELNVPNSLIELFINMQERSEKYFGEFVCED